MTWSKKATSLIYGLLWMGTAQASSVCETHEPRYLVASCLQGSCVGHQSGYLPLKTASGNCTNLKRYSIGGLRAQDQQFAANIMKTMRRSQGSFVAEVRDVASCRVSGSVICVDDFQVHIRRASSNPASAFVIANLATALQKKTHTEQGLLWGEVFFLLQVLLSSYVVLVLAWQWIAHSRRRLIAGVITLIYMSVFLFFYGKQAFFERPEVWPLLNSLMLGIMVCCVVTAVRAIRSDIHGVYRVCLDYSVFVGEALVVVYLATFADLSLVGLVDAIFFVAVPAALAVFYVSATVCALRKAQPVDDGLGEDEVSFRFVTH